MTTSNAGLWAPWYAGLPADAAPRPYGASETYQMGADWLKGCTTVQDWGCGFGWARQFYRPDQYLGVDGTASPFADVVVDLAGLRPVDRTNLLPMPEGIFMRGVIEHDYNWATILGNAYRWFERRMCLVLFTPIALHGPVELDFVNEIGVPDLSFSMRNITGPLHARKIDYLVQTVVSPDTGYDVETIFFMER